MESESPADFNQTIASALAKLALGEVWQGLFQLGQGTSRTPELNAGLGQVAKNGGLGAVSAWQVIPECGGP